MCDFKLFNVNTNRHFEDLSTVFFCKGLNVHEHFAHKPIKRFSYSDRIRSWCGMLLHRCLSDLFHDCYASCHTYVSPLDAQKSLLKQWAPWNRRSAILNYVPFLLFCTQCIFKNLDISSWKQDLVVCQTSMVRANWNFSYMMSVSACKHLYGYRYIPYIILGLPVTGQRCVRPRLNSPNNPQSLQHFMANLISTHATEELLDFFSDL